MSFLEKKLYFLLPRSWVLIMTRPLTKIIADVSISEKIQNFDDFSGFCSPEFDSFLRDLAIKM